MLNTIIIIIFKIYIVLNIICGEIAIRRFSKIIKCKFYMNIAHSHICKYKIFIRCLYDENAARKRIVFTFFEGRKGFTLPDV